MIKATHVVELPVNGAWQPTDIESQQTGRADFWVRQGEYVVVSDSGIVHTSFAHFDLPEKESAEHFARSMSGYGPRPFVLRVQPYWYAAAYGPLSDEQVARVRKYVAPEAR